MAPCSDAHALGDARSLAMHRVIASRLDADAGLLERARARVAGWLETGGCHRRYALAWREILSLPTPEIASRLIDPSEHGRALRSASPFAGALSARERWRIHKAVRAGGTAATR